MNSKPSVMQPENEYDLGRRSLDRDGLKKAIRKLDLQRRQGSRACHPPRLVPVTALAVRDRMVDGWMETTRDIYGKDRKRVYYLSLDLLRMAGCWPRVAQPG
ncbi:MAG: hypothetical protein R3D03_04510 [Geminicoccaceae bacterium]